MKIGNIRDGRLFVTRGSTVGTYRPGGGFEPLGEFPVPDAQPVATTILNGRLTKRALSRITGWYTSSNVWALDDRHLIATFGRFVFRSRDGGESWRVVFELPSPSGPMGVLPTSLCHHEGRVYLSEYTFGDVDARILASDDLGESWSTFFETPDYRHFHGVFYDRFEKRLWGATGDSDEDSSIGVFDDDRYRVIGNGDQKWRTVGIAFTPEYVIWGMDCSYRDSVKVLGLPREETDESAPSPIPLTNVTCPVFYLETLEVEGVTWVVVATQAETGIDSTAPAGSINRSSRTAKVIAASSKSEYRDWHELFSFDRTRTVSEFVDRIPTANGYVYISADSDFGLAVNPFNMGEDHGKVFTVSPQQFTEMEG